MQDSYVSNAKRRCDDCSYMLDTALAGCLARFFQGRTLTELGAGIGRYAKAIRASGLTGRVIAYDGMPDVESKSGGAVRRPTLPSTPTPHPRATCSLRAAVASHVSPDPNPSPSPSPSPSPNANPNPNRAL